MSSIEQKLGLNSPKLGLALEIIFFAAILACTFHTFVTSDFWFHLKTGEYIVTHGSIPFVDYFSHSVYGHPIVPYEWLDEILLYFIYQNFGFLGVGIMSSLFLFLYYGIYRQILVEIFKLDLLSRIFLMGVTALLNNPYFSERPQIIAYNLYMLILYITLKRVFQGKNLLWLTIPILLIWSNLHASMILGLALVGSYAAGSLIKYYFSKSKIDFKQFRDFSVYTIIGFVITVLPPLGFGVYQMLWKFYQNRVLISSFIDEWAPLNSDSELLAVYTALYLVAAAAFLWVIFKNKREAGGGKRKELLFLFLPLLPVALFGLTGQRQSPFSQPTLFLFLIPFIKKINLKVSKIVPLSLTVIVIGLTAFNLNFFQTKNAENYQAGDQYLPRQAIGFIKANLKGNMLNDFGLGGYLLYRLGPEQKVFIDGRTEMYLPEVMTDSKGFADNKYENEDDLLNYFNGVVSKYHISWAFLPSENFTVWRKIMHILYGQPNWHLVYFDDAGEIFVKDDGINDQTIKKYNMDAITPFQGTIYLPGKQQQALAQFQQMEALSPSSVASNSIGYILFAQKQPEQAKNYFIQAINYNPLDQTATTARINLAEVYAKEGNLDQAINLYIQVLHDDPERGTAYIRGGELLLQLGRPRSEAIQVWENGLKHTQFDGPSQAKLQQDIEANQ